MLLVAIFFLVLWVIGLLASYTMGGFINVLLVGAILLFGARFVAGRKP